LGEGTVKTTVRGARRLAVTKQHLAGKRPKKASREDIISMIRNVGYIQWDPVAIVAPSHLISIWSRVGDFEPSDLERLLWEEKKVFEHWTPVASIVLTEDYPLYCTLMKGYPESLSKSWGNHIPRARKFLASHLDLRKRILRDLKKGPLLLSQFSDYTRTKRSSDGWSSENDVSNMLFHLSMRGEVMVVGHDGNQNVWGLSEDFLPEWTDRKPLAQEEFERVAAQRAIRALGTASPSEIVYYFVRGRYQNLKKALAQLEGESAIHRVEVEGLGREVRYVHDKDLALLDSLEGDGWHPRTSLIPPFDNMLAGQRRGLTVFGFNYVREQFLPKQKRRYGTYVLPIVHGENLIGRIDPSLDKENGRLIINSVHAEPGAAKTKEAAADIRAEIDRLAAFVGMKEVEYLSPVPDFWRNSLR
jgi:uncharacterized protein